VSTDLSEEPGGFELPGWPAFPAGVLPHASVDVQADDPALVEHRERMGSRQCVTSRADGERCRARAGDGELLCNLHAGRLDSAQGGRALAQKKREAKARAEEDMGRRSLGTRAMIADVLHERAQDVARVVNSLIDAAAAGDMKAQSLLLPYINQALGLPTERVEHSAPQDASGLRSASTEELEALVARGRSKRLSAVPDEHTG
jgi:hypothetical protein